MKNGKLQKPRPVEAETLIRQIGSKEAADLLGVSPRLLEKWRRNGEGPRFVRLSHKCVRYRLVDLQDFQEERLRASNAAA